MSPLQFTRQTYLMISCFVMQMTQNKISIEKGICKFMKPRSRGWSCEGFLETFSSGEGNRWNYAENYWRGICTIMFLLRSATRLDSWSEFWEETWIERWAGCWWPCNPPKHVRSRYPVLIFNSLIAGHRFYDDNEYDDGYAEYTGEIF